MLRGRLWQVGQEVCVAVRAAFAVLECVVERGEELERPLDSCIVVPHFAYAFQGLVVRECAKVGFPKVTLDEFESPNDDAGVQIQEESLAFPSLAQLG